MQKIKQKNFLLCILIMVIAIAIFIGLSIFTLQRNVCFNNEDVKPFNNGWSYMGKDGENLQVNLPTDLSVPSGTKYSVSKRLPKNLMEGMTLCIRASQQSVLVQVEGEEIYQYGFDENKKIDTCVGSLWNFVTIPQTYAGKEITLTFHSKYEAFSGHINAISYGSKSAILFEIFKTYGFGVLLAFVVLMMGIVLLFASLILKRMKFNVLNLFYLSLFEIFISLWLLGESRMLQFIIDNYFLVTNLALFALMLVPIPMLLFVDATFSGRNRKGTQIFCIIFVVNFVVNIAMQLLSIFDFFQMIFVTNLINGATILYMSYVVLLEMIKYKNKEAKFLAISLLILLVFGLLEIINFFSENFLMVSSFVKMGLLIYIGLLSIFTTKKMKDVIEQNAERQYYQRLAREDPLTKSKNRTAYFMDIAKILKEQELPNIILAIFDLNNLKRVNDYYGHTMGDTAIIDCYNCIHSTFSQLGDCYRIGGDEFACIIKNCEQELFYEALILFRKRIFEIDKKREYHFDIAIGYACYDCDGELDFDDLASKADQFMYANKRKKKKKENLL